MMKKTGLVMLGALISGSAMADQLFTMDVTVDAVSKSYGFNNVDEVYDEVVNFDTFPNYTSSSQVAADIDYRGVAMKVTYAPGSTDMVFEVPSINFKKTFTGTTRDASSNQFEDFLTSEGADVLNQIQKELIANSPVDPIAGNPSSLMGSMVSSQFESGYTQDVTEIADTAAPTTEAEAVAQAASNPNMAALGARFGRYSVNGVESEVISLPLGYSFNFDGGKGLRSISLSMPITMVDTAGAKTGSVSLGLGVTYGVTDRWALTPAVSAGVVGSVDLGSAGGIGSASITSSYKMPLDNGNTLSIGNMVGYFQTLEFEYGDYKFDPGVSNTVARNGLMLSQPHRWQGRDLAVEYWFTDTRFFGDALYSEYYDEVGVSVGLAKRANGGLENYLRGGVSYMWGDGDVSGFKLNLGYSF